MSPSSTCRERRRHRRRRTRPLRQRSGGGHDWAQPTRPRRARRKQPRRRQQPLLLRNHRRRPPEDELEPWEYYRTRTMHEADVLSAPSGITSWIFRKNQIYWRPAMMIAKHGEDHWTKLVSNWNPATSTRNKEDGPRDEHRTSRSTYNQTDPTGTTTISQATCTDTRPPYFKRQEF